MELRALHRESELKPKQPQRPRGNPRRGPDDLDPHKEAESKLPKEELPAEFKKLFVKKPGYANYYFNQLEQTRVLHGLELMQSWRDVAGRWKATGKTSAGEDFVITFADKGLGLELPNRPGLQPLEGADFIDEPPHSGGLLAALYQLKLLLTKGPESFTEFSYVGSQPLDGGGAMVDVLATKKSGVEALWYFNKSDGQFVGFDSSLGSDVDPCKIRFLGFGSLGGRRFPNRFVVRYGDTEFATFDVQTLDVAEPGKKPDGGQGD